MKKSEIKQKFYGNFIILNLESDIIEICQKKDEYNLIQIEREKIPKLIYILNKIYHEKTL